MASIFFFKRTFSGTRLAGTTARPPQGDRRVVLARMWEPVPDMAVGNDQVADG